MPSHLLNLRSQIPAPALTAAQQQLAKAMVVYWTNFAKLGTPNWIGAPDWPAYERTTDEMQSLVPPTPGVETGFALDHRCAIWAPAP